MNSTAFSRRTVMAGAAAAASALLPMQQAVAQTASAGGDWMAMIKAHHLAISKTFDELLASPAGAKRNGLLRRLGYQLSAHSLAEENVLYPALAMNGMVTEADKLYIDQAHAKVMNAETEMAAMKDKAGTAWMDKAKALQAAVLKHAKEDEEANLYPKLHEKAGAAMNAELTMKYKREFDMVKPVRG